ncbi:DUF2877 domain-containing protein [Enterococcus sp. BWT-B8]|uniref:DUF2877 domain-containing protein n=1 Tax=Enterococcus sp. BWT-B8 TaxID=2885157 RepID=UPI001E28322D|nr:DUF2877 domain-containing protein [Enterococcus sp. BWT-B8]MCB5951217.1 DUF2877 domain-containing protein [Enterococcus sp. BWT-B8]
MLAAEWVDQVLFDSQLMKGYWYIHSIFQKSFNIQDQQKKYLVTITAQETKIPKGIKVAEKDFLILKNEIWPEMPLLIQQRLIIFPQHQLSFQSAQSYSTKWAAQSATFDPKLFFLLISKVNKETGYQEKVNAALSSQHQFCQAIDQVCQDSFSQQQIGLNFLLGRGLGLTPSGDDMLVGHFLARLLMKAEDQRLIRYLQHKLETVPDLTTDVSLHYLKNALQGSFSQLPLAVSQCQEEAKSYRAIQEILKTGHTSGADFLAGFARSIYRFQQNRNEGSLWQSG